MSENSKMFIPGGFQTLNSVNESVDPAEYFQKRMAQLGVTDDNNFFLVRQTDITNVHGPEIEVKMPVFSQHKDGIEILVSTLDQCIIRYAAGESRWKHGRYSLIRLVNPIVKPNGSVIKYLMPKKQPTNPFFHPALIAKYQAAKQWRAENPDAELPKHLKITNLYFTEGYFKAWAGQHLAGIDVVGFPSITIMKNDGKIYADVAELIKVCGVERAIWLTDGDCRNITTKELTEEKDLYTRPHSFFSTISTFYELLSNFTDVKKIFGYINTWDLAKELPNGIEAPKGLDDLLITFPDKIEEIAREFNDFSHRGKHGEVNGHWISRIDIGGNISRISMYFFLNDVNAFYAHHSQLREDFKQLEKFKYHGTIYTFNKEKGVCEMVVSRETNDFIRVGDTYYKKIEIPSVTYQRDGATLKTISARQKGTVIDDLGKSQLQFIPQYNEFCIVPDHHNYQQVINNCYNLYSPFTYEPEEGECGHILSFIKHVFGDEEIEGIPRYELGLDYIKLLYEKPDQMLPILSLVSTERQTGKTSFAELLDRIFIENSIFIGNEDMSGDFNAHWVSKLLIICDETHLDDVKAIQKIKRLSTATKTVMNTKGKQQVTMPFFAKFILISNHVEDFIRIDKEEIRFWVIRVPALKNPDVHLKAKMYAEIPAFLQYLANRKMVTEYKERHWFKTSLLNSLELEAVKENSMNKVEKQIRREITNLFELLPQEEELKLPLKYIAELTGTKDENYVAKMLRTMGHKSMPGRFRYPFKFENVVDSSVIGAAAPHIRKACWLEMNTTYYKFERADWVSTQLKKNQQKRVMMFLFNCIPRP